MHPSQALHPGSVGSEPFGVLAQVGQCGVEAFPAGSPCGVWGQWVLDQSVFEGCRKFPFKAPMGSNLICWSWEGPRWGVEALDLSGPPELVTSDVGF